ncbi:hypothetical protein BRCON_1961 [Candidatus Sumerlaea chitinivorans]|uniref:Uncharacterized protein n=1 Tax=Sumerlaea chitinivorans TaxID=2250252 RepID=A0A2Z4Y7B9_SUMC1|nr:hypothetical protein BRCON_1961 [Candidatus Sumerlaea chitinivorans]
MAFGGSARKAIRSTPSPFALNVPSLQRSGFGRFWSDFVQH